MLFSSGYMNDLFSACNWLGVSVFVGVVMENYPKLRVMVSGDVETPSGLT